MITFTVGATGRNYVDIGAFHADAPDPFTDDITLLLYNDAEFLSASEISLAGLNQNGFKLIIKPADGEGFNTTEKPLRYGQANGVAIRKTSSYNSIFNSHGADVEISGIQWSTGTRNARAAYLGIGSSGSIDNCIFESASTLECIQFAQSTIKLTNSTLILLPTSGNGAEGIFGSYGAAESHNCTIVCLNPSNAGYGARKTGGLPSLVKNTAFFGFGTAVQSGFLANGSDHNASDDNSFDQGSNNQTNLTFANQFENVAGVSTLDLRLKNGNDLDSNGTPDSAFTNDLDIFGNDRSLTAPSIGAYETLITTGLTRISKMFQFDLMLTGRVNKNHIVTMDLLQKVIKDFQITMSLLSSVSVSRDFQISIDLLHSISRNYDITTNLLQSASRDHNINLTLLNSEIKNFSISINALKREVLNHVMNFDFHHKVNKSFQFRLDLFEGVKVSKPFSIALDLQERIQREFDIELKLLERIVQDHKIVVTLLNKVTMDFINRFNLLNRTSTDFTISLDFIERVDKRFSMVFRVDSDIITKTPAHYVLSVTDTIDLSDSDELTTIHFSNNEGVIII